MLYQIRDFARLRRCSHLIWDIDGTITDEAGRLSQEVAAKIINLGLAGVYHSFITGRDAQWIIEKVIEPMRAFYNFPRVRDNLIFYAEVGCVILSVDAEGHVVKRVATEVADHPIRVSIDGIRGRLRTLVHDPAQLTPHQASVPVEPPLEVIYDANDRGWVYDPTKGAPPCHPYIWSGSKEVFATYEKLRDADGRVKSFDQGLYEERIHAAITELGLGDIIGTEVISTAINIIPKVNGARLGKSWAAGKALLHVWEAKLGKGVVLEQVIAGTVAVGDGRADLDFTVPTFPPDVAAVLNHPIVQIIFVGGEHDLPGAADPNANLREHIIIRATGQGDLAFDYTKDVIRLQAAKGSRVVSEVLDFLQLWDYFQPF